MLTSDKITDTLATLFSISDYANAQALVEKARDIPSLYNDVIAIYDANLCKLNNDYSSMWEAIRRGLSYNCENYELYMLLGEYYLPTNPNQAYLCIENALFHCKNNEDLDTIKYYLNQIKENFPITVRKTSFIILSYNLLDYTKRCIESIREHSSESAREIIVVDNASEDESVTWLKSQEDIILRANKENSGFPKGCNEGIELASPNNDIFLLNNDTLLTPNALFWLRMGLYENDKHGCTGCISNHVSNLQQITFSNPSTEDMLQFAKYNNTPMHNAYESKIYLVGFALLIRRDVLNMVGLLDEEFSPGNYEDTDYGLRVLNAGYKNILCKNSFIVHFGSKSFGKNTNSFVNILEINKQKLLSKWDMVDEQILYPNLAFIRSINQSSSDSFTILEYSCGFGATAAYIKSNYPNVYICGIESTPALAAIAMQHVDEIYVDEEALFLACKMDSFDYVLTKQ